MNSSCLRRQFVLGAFCCSTTFPRFFTNLAASVPFTLAFVLSNVRRFLTCGKYSLAKRAGIYGKQLLQPTLLHTDMCFSIRSALNFLPHVPQGTKLLGAAEYSGTSSTPPPEPPRARRTPTVNLPSHTSARGRIPSGLESSSAANDVFRAGGGSLAPLGSYASK